MALASEIFKAHVENEVAWVKVYIFPGGRIKNRSKRQLITFIKMYRRNKPVLEGTFINIIKKNFI